MRFPRLYRITSIGYVLIPVALQNSVTRAILLLRWISHPWDFDGVHECYPAGHFSHETENSHFLSALSDLALRELPGQILWENYLFPSGAQKNERSLHFLVGLLETGPWIWGGRHNQNLPIALFQFFADWTSQWPGQKIPLQG